MSPPRESDSNRTELILREGAHVFGRYDLLGILGEGGMGVVWRARDEKLERDVALKFLPDRVQRDPEEIRDLKRETRRCLDLTHPNIVRVYDFVEDSFAAAIAMEYVSGKSLAALKAVRPGGCFDVADLAPWVRQLGGALDYAHQQAGVVHRDLKPANLLLTTDGMLKVADFGIASSLREAHTRQTNDQKGASGTLGFMGPQQLENKGKPAPSDDLYSLGATLYDLLTGKPPFFGGDIFTAIRTGVPVPLGERRAVLENTGAPIPPEWERAIFACLAKRAEDRPASAGAMLAMLGEHNAPVEVKAATTTAPAPPPPELATPLPPAPNHGTIPERGPKPRTAWPNWSPGAALGAAALLAVIFWRREAPPTFVPPVSTEHRPALEVANPTADRSATSAPAAGERAKTEERGPAAPLTPAPAANGVTDPAAGSASPTAPAPTTAATHLPVMAPAVLPREFVVTVDQPHLGAHLWIGPLSNFAVPAGGRAVLKDLSDGEHQLEVQAPGYQRFTTRVTVKDGRGSAQAKLTPIPSVTVGMTEAKLIELKGSQQSKAVVGEKAIYRFSDMQVTLVRGKVEQIQLRDLATEKENAARRAAASAAKKQATAEAATTVTPSSLEVDPTATVTKPAATKTELTVASRLTQIVSLQEEVAALERELDADAKRSSFGGGPAPLSSEARTLLNLRLEEARAEIAALK